MLNCRDVTEHASDYLDKTLPLGQRLKLRLHLFMCIHCRRYLKQLRVAIDLIRQSEPRPVSTQQAETIAAKILSDSSRDAR
ncbi:MAG: zf-HC2 domain-containing protein [Pseudomonadota bacterium]